MKRARDIQHRRFTLVELLVVMMMIHRRELLLGGILVLMLHGAAALAGPKRGSLAQRERQQGDFWQFGENGRATTDVVLLGAAADSELVANAADWIASFVERSAHVRLAVRRGSRRRGSRIS